MTMLEPFLSVLVQQTAPPVDYTPAFIGLGGVLVGAGITALSQWTQRRAEHRKYVGEKLAEILRDAYLLEAKLKGLVKNATAPEDRRPPVDFFESLVNEINGHSETLISNAHHLVLLSSRRVSDLASEVTDACVRARNYQTYAADPEHEVVLDKNLSLRKIHEIKEARERLVEAVRPRWWRK